MGLTLLGEEGPVVEGLHQGWVQTGRLQATAAAAGALLVQLRLDADWTLVARHAPLDLPAQPSVRLTLEKSQLPGGVLHTLPLLQSNEEKT